MVTVNCCTDTASNRRKKKNLSDIVQWQEEDRESFPCHIIFYPKPWSTCSYVKRGHVTVVVPHSPYVKSIASQDIYILDANKVKTLCDTVVFVKCLCLCVILCICSRAGSPCWSHKTPLAGVPSELVSWMRDGSMVLRWREYCQRSGMWLIRTGLGSLLPKPYSADSKDHWDSMVMEKHDGAIRESQEILWLILLWLMSNTICGNPSAELLKAIMGFIIWWR